jgi:hypothetical protein
MQDEINLIIQGLPKIKNGTLKRLDYFSKNSKVTIYSCGVNVIRIDIKNLNL